MKNSKINLILTFSLISTISYRELSLVVKAQTQPTKTQLSIASQLQNGELKNNRSKKKRSTWEAILNLFRGSNKGRNLGSRGVCFVSPGILEEKNIIWHDRPLFLWQIVNFNTTNKESLLPKEIRLYTPFDSTQEQEILWRQNLDSSSSAMNFQRVRYTGEPLELGKIYDWKIFDGNSKTQKELSFKIMDGTERDAIVRDLQNLEIELKAENATDEEIALERANYFMQKNLWSDALQEIFSIENPPIESMQAIQTMLTELCTTIEPNIN
jgi:hypothetical protein